MGSLQEGDMLERHTKPRNHPSFPTRRSSDLHHAVGARLPDPLSHGMGLGSRGQICIVGLDRKSTRLNSSHTVISYAVFCLKKKTLVIIMVANKYAFLQITRSRFLNEWQAYNK